MREKQTFLTGSSAKLSLCGANNIRSILGYFRFIGIMSVDDSGMQYCYNIILWIFLQLDFFPGWVDKF